MIELDIFSDTVCPWCYIGKKRLDKAIEKYSHLEIKQTWRPFWVVYQVEFHQVSLRQERCSQEAVWADDCAFENGV